MNPPRRTIVIEDHGPNFYTVRVGPFSAPGLCWDEMLGAVTELAHPKLGTTRIAMCTDEEWARRDAQRAERMAAINEEKA